MKRVLLATAACSLALAAVPLRESAAQAVQGLYVAGGAGVTWLSETNAPVAPPASANLSTPSDAFNRSWEPGFVGVLSVGYGYAFGLRFELEGFYRTNEASSGTVFNRPASAGTATSYGLMGNVLYDIPIGMLNPPVIPYVGAGLG